jgi:hypothetical protein
MNVVTIEQLADYCVGLTAGQEEYLKERLRLYVGDNAIQALVDCVLRDEDKSFMDDLRVDVEDELDTADKRLRDVEASLQEKFEEDNIEFELDLIEEVQRGFRRIQRRVEKDCP